MTQATDRTTGHDVAVACVEQPPGVGLEAQLNAVRAAPQKATPRGAGHTIAGPNARRLLNHLGRASALPQVTCGLYPRAGRPTRTSRRDTSGGAR